MYKFFALSLSLFLSSASSLVCFPLLSSPWNFCSPKFTTFIPTKLGVLVSICFFLLFCLRVCFRFSCVFCFFFLAFACQFQFATSGFFLVICLRVLHIRARSTHHTHKNTFHLGEFAVYQISAFIPLSDSFRAAKWWWVSKFLWFFLSCFKEWRENFLMMIFALFCFCCWCYNIGWSCCGYFMQWSEARKRRFFSFFSKRVVCSIAVQMQFFLCCCCRIVEMFAL